VSLDAHARLLVRLAVRSLRAHRLRSGLSVLGVVCGVAAVVAMSSVGEGARRETLAQIEALGIETVTARPALAPSGGGGAALPLAGVESLRRVVPGVVALAPVRVAELSADAGTRSKSATVLGTTPAYREALRLDVASGRFLADVDVKGAQRVAVIGASLARALFPLSTPVGETLRLGGDFYRVVGVLEARTSPRARGAALTTRDMNRVVIVPLTALDHGGAPDGADEIVLRAASADAVAPTAALTRSVLRRVSGAAAVELVVPREILAQRRRTQRVFDVVTGAVAAISLLVGGIGIMNIMLASVAERTREVGVRRAIGARRKDVAAQFLVESALLSTGGSVPGLLLGVVGAWLIQRLAGWPVAVDPAMLVLALGAALLVGIAFGSYPAWRAASLSPMEALRRD
jgi:putative ABC transport system permease protein